MRRLACPALLLGLLLAAGVASPQPAAVSATQALEIEGMAMRLVSLLRNAPEVGQALADLDARQSDERSARYSRFPRLDVQGEAGSLSTDLARDASARVDSRLVASTRYTVWDFGRTTARIAAAEHGVAAGQQMVRQAAQAVALDALTTYLQVLRFALLREVGRNSERALQTIERLEGRRVELGGAGITDARLASSRLALSTNRLVQFEASLEEARSRFAVLFGFRPPPEQLPPLRIPGALLAGDAEQLLEAARESNPELLAARRELEQAKQTLEAERAARWPAVDLSYSRRYEFPGGYSDKAQLGVVLQTNSLNFLESQARVGRAAARVTQDEEHVRQLERDAEQAVRTARDRQTLGQRREDLLKLAAGESAAVFRGRERLNAAGRETTLALLDAQVEANNVLVDWVNAVFDQRLAELRLAKESGRLLPDADQELSWARALFATDDFRAPVLAQLGAGTPAPAAPAGAPASVPAVLPTRSGLGEAGQAWSLRIGLVRMQR